MKQPIPESERCQGPTGRHWFVQHIGDQNKDTYKTAIAGCVFCSRIDLTRLPETLGTEPKVNDVPQGK